MRPGSSAGVEQLSGVVEPTPKAPRTCALALKYPCREGLFVCYMGTWSLRALCDAGGAGQSAGTHPQPPRRTGWCVDGFRFTVFTVQGLGFRALVLAYVAAKQRLCPKFCPDAASQSYPGQSYEPGSLNSKIAEA